jgi:sugar/nucleoside kinase (ribokinase family)
MSTRFDVTLCGELNLDLILYGLPDELDLEREALCKDLSLTLGSSSAILAHNLARLGTRVGFISRVGNDPLGQVALDWLASAGVDVSRVHRVPHGAATGLTVVLQHPGGRHMLTYPGAMFEMSWEDLDLEYLADARHFHLSSYFLHRGLRPRIPELFRRMKEAGLSTSLDTNDDPEDAWGKDVHETLRYVDIFLPNELEASRIAGVQKPSKERIFDYTDTIDQTLDKLAKLVPLLVVKRGAAGAVARRGAELMTRPAVPVDVVDAVGAGDSFDAGFLHKYLHGADLGACLEFGNRVAALSLTKAGGTSALREKLPEDLHK